MRKSEQSFHLLPFPGNNPHEVAITGTIKRHHHQLTITYCISGDLDDVVWPSGLAGVFRKGLWENTCLELFVAEAGNSKYQEWNFAPSREWCTFRFDDYRQPQSTYVASVPPRFSEIRRESDTMTMEITLEESNFQGFTSLNGLWEVGITAVTKHTDGAFVYWALKHGSDKPDFHQRSSFILRI